MLPDPHRETGRPRPGLDLDAQADLDQQVIRSFPDIVLRLRATWQEQRLADLKRLTHDIIGLGAIARCNSLGNSAARISHALGALGDAPTNTQLLSVKQQLDDLIRLCEEVAAA